MAPEGAKRRHRQSSRAPCRRQADSRPKKRSHAGARENRPCGARPAPAPRGSPTRSRADRHHRARSAAAEKAAADKRAAAGKAAAEAAAANTAAQDVADAKTAAVAKAATAKAAVGGNGRALAVGLWEPETGRPLPAASVPYGTEKARRRLGWFPPALGPGGKRIAALVGSGAISVWDVGNGDHLVELKGSRALAANTTRIAFSPDGRRLATASESGELRVWDPDTGVELLTLRMPEAVVHHLAFTADGQGIRLVVKTRAGFEAWLLDGSPRPCRSSVR